MTLLLFDFSLSCIIIIRYTWYCSGLVVYEKTELDVKSSAARHVVCKIIDVEVVVIQIKDRLLKSNADCRSSSTEILSQPVCKGAVCHLRRLPCTLSCCKPSPSMTIPKAAAHHSQTSPFDVPYDKRSKTSTPCSISPSVAKCLVNSGHEIYLMITLRARTSLRIVVRVGSMYQVWAIRHQENP